VTDYRSMVNMNSLNALSLLERGLSTSYNALKGLGREMRGLIFPSVMSGGVFFYLQTNASADPALHTEWSTGTDFLLFLAIASCFFCDTALEFFTGRLITPFWHRVRERRPASTASSAGTSRSLRQWLCSPCRNEKNTRPFRSVHISHNPPPLTTSLSIYACI